MASPIRVMSASGCANTEITAPRRRALSATEPRADPSQRRRCSRQRPEENGDLRNASITAEAQMVDEFNLQAVDLRPAHQETTLIAHEFVGVAEILEHIEDDAGQRLDLLAALERELVGERRMEFGVNGEGIGDCANVVPLHSGAHGRSGG